MHKLMSIVLSAVVIALCRAIRVVCLHDVSVMYTCLESAHERGRSARTTHVARVTSLPHEPSHIQVMYAPLPQSLISLVILAHGNIVSSVKTNRNVPAVTPNGSRRKKHAGI
jgi:hypothetical protein